LLYLYNKYIVESIIIIGIPGDIKTTKLRKNSAGKRYAYVIEMTETTISII